MSLLRPGVYRDNVASIVRTYRHFGAAHTAFITGRNYHVGQGGDEVDNVLGEALVGGVPGIDWRSAAPVALHNALEERSFRYREQGWFAVGDPSPEPDNQPARPGSSTPAFALNDFYAARLAEAIGDTGKAALLRARSRSWRNVWNPEAISDDYRGFIIPRYPDGRFQPLDPKIGWNGKKYENVGFYEGTAWVYSYTMLHDVPGMIDAMGERALFTARLGHALDAGVIDITNEPSFATPWLFSDVGRPDLASYWAERIFGRFTADAYPGDEDNGAMSSHYESNRLGLLSKLTNDLYYLHARHQPRGRSPARVASASRSSPTIGSRVVSISRRRHSTVAASTRRSSASAISRAAVRCGWPFLKPRRAGRNRRQARSSHAASDKASLAAVSAHMLCRISSSAHC